MPVLYTELARGNGTEIPAQAAGASYLLYGGGAAYQVFLPLAVRGYR